MGRDVLVSICITGGRLGKTRVVPMGEMSWFRSALSEVDRAKQGSLWGEMSWSRSAFLEVARAKQGSSLWGEMSGFDLLTEGK